MRRREFLGLFGGAAAWPLAARAQQAAVPVVGYLYAGTPATSMHLLAAFRKGLGEAGFVENQNVVIVARFAENQYDRLAILAADLVRRQVAVLVAIGASALAARDAATTIPVVFSVGVDPIEAGLVSRLNRPGGNLTGATLLNVELGPKRLELLHEAVPGATSLAFLVNPMRANADAESRAMLAAAGILGLRLHVLPASNEHDIDVAFASLIQLRAGGLVVGGDTFFSSRHEQLAALALRHAIPIIYQYREFAAAGA